MVDCDFCSSVYISGGLRFKILFFSDDFVVNLLITFENLLNIAFVVLFFLFVELFGFEPVNYFWSGWSGGSMLIVFYARL